MTTKELRKINEDFKLIGKKMGCYIIDHPSYLCYIGYPPHLCHIEIDLWIKETLYLDIEGEPYKVYFVCIERPRPTQAGIIIGEYHLIAPVYNARLRYREYIQILEATLVSDGQIYIEGGIEEYSDLLFSKIKKHSRYFNDGELDANKMKKIRKYANIREDSDPITTRTLPSSYSRKKRFQNISTKRLGVMILEKEDCFLLPYAYLMASSDKVKVRVGKNEFEAHFLKMEDKNLAGIYYLAIPSIVKTTGNRSLFPVARAELKPKGVIELSDLLGFENGNKLAKLILEHSVHIKNGRLIKNGRWRGTLAEHHISVVLPTVSEKPHLSKVRDYCIRKNLDAQMVGHYTSDDC